MSQGGEPNPAREAGPKAHTPEHRPETPPGDQGQGVRQGSAASVENSHAKWTRYGERSNVAKTLTQVGT